MSHVDFQKWQCRISVAYFPQTHYVKYKKLLGSMSLHFEAPYCMTLSPTARIKFKKCSCRPVDLRGRGPCCNLLN